MNYKKILTLTGATLVLSTFIWVAWWFYTYGTLEVSTQESSEVSILEVEQAELAQNTIGTGDLQKRLRPGTYTVVAESPEGGSTQSTVTINSRETTFIDLNVDPLKQAETILNGASYNIVSHRDRYRFFDPNLQLLYELRHGSDQATPVFFELYPVVGVDWLDINNALVEMRNHTHSLIRNNRVVEFPYPDNLSLEGSEQGIVTHDINDRGQIVILIDGKIFFYDNFSSSPRQIYEVEDDDISLTLSNEGLIFIHVEAFAFGHSDVQSHNILIDSRGQTLETLSELEDSSVTFASWNRSGDKLLLEIDGEINIFDMTTQNIERALQHPPQNIEATKWLDDDRILMIIRNGIFEVSTDTKTVKKLVNLDNPINHSGALTLSNGYLLYSTSPSGDFSYSGTFYRVDLN